MGYRSALYTGSITRPSDTNAYVATDLVANDTTAGNVTPFTVKWEGQALRGVSLRRVCLKHSKATVTNSSFKIWFLDTAPTMTNGDNGTIAGPALATILGIVTVDVDNLVTGAGASGEAYFREGQIFLPPTSYALIEANAAYTPASAEVFTLELRGDPY